MASDAAELSSIRRDHSRGSRHHERKPLDSKDKNHTADHDATRQHRDERVRNRMSERSSAQKFHRDGGHRSHGNIRSQRGHDDERGRKLDRYIRHDHDHDEERRHKHKSRFQSRVRPRRRSRSLSCSPDGRSSKRQSGFDMAPSNDSVSPALMPGQPVPGLTAVIPGVLPGIFPFATLQYGGLPTVSMQSMTQQATRHARRIYVGGLPLQANEQIIATFFSQVMQAIGGNTAGPGDAVVNVYINHEKKFAFVEMRTVEEASNAMALDGIIFEGVSVRIRRPTDYSPSIAATLGPSQPNPHLNLSAVGLTPGAIGGADGPDRVFVGGLPYYLTDTQIKELLESFGQLRGFDLVRDQDTGNSKGYGFCVYQDPAVTDVACAALNGLKMGDKTLTVRRATASGQPRPEKVTQQQLPTQVATTAIASLPNFSGLITALSTGLMPGIIPGLISGMPSSKVICLSQVVTLEELKEDDVYEEIYDDMKDECSKYGTLVNIVIPRPSPLGKNVAGVGKVFLHYSDEVEAKKANEALHGRKFGGNTVLAVYYPEEKFLKGEYDS